MDVNRRIRNCYEYCAKQGIRPTMEDRHVHMPYMDTLLGIEVVWLTRLSYSCRELMSRFLIMPFMTVMVALWQPIMSNRIFTTIFCTILLSSTTPSLHWRNPFWPPRQTSESVCNGYIPARMLVARLLSLLSKAKNFSLHGLVTPPPFYIENLAKTSTWSTLTSPHKK